jgi:hypothetical protein
MVAVSARAALRALHCARCEARAAWWRKGARIDGGAPARALD